MKIFSFALPGFLLTFLTFSSIAQIRSLGFDQPLSFTIKEIFFPEHRSIALPYGIPLFSVMIDNNFYNSYCAKTQFSGDTIFFVLADSIHGWVTQVKDFNPGLKFTIHFNNHGRANHAIENLVPLGEGGDKVYITAEGTKDWPQYLCRSRLYRRGYGPVGVILPDNLWHLGFADFQINDSVSLTALARRGARDKERTDIDRWAVTLKPGGWAEYSVYIDTHTGDWHEGMKMMFHERWLYDLPEFDNSLFKRPDLSWMRNTYVMLLQFAWDKKYYDYIQNESTFYKNLFEYDSLTGGFDIYTLWPTWPRLGLDQRNQWDMYRDLPGGLTELKKQVEFTHQHGKKYFISYNPWDEGTRTEDQLKGMEDLLRATSADGVVLDTKGSSSRELQAAADKVKPGVIMYSEGMAIPKDMPGIVSGRVHDALVMPPPLNLNKLIKPDFAIFRVLQLADDRIHRELAMAFFNGYGVEINTMRPGRPDWITEEFAYLGRTTKILRENTMVFHNDNFFPLVNTIKDSIYVNRWESENKLLFTILSLNPKGHDGPLFETDFGSLTKTKDEKIQPFSIKEKGPGDEVVKWNLHVVDLWNHVEIDTVIITGKLLIPVHIEPFDRAWLNTRKEGTVGCVAVFKKQLQVTSTETGLSFKSLIGDKIVISGENPSYSTKSFTYPITGQTIAYRDLFPATMNKIVIQLFSENELTDEVVLIPEHQAPRLISRSIPTSRAKVPPAGMVEIPAGTFKFYTKRDPNTQDPFIPLPGFSDTVDVKISSFFMDRFPVTNLQFLEFLNKTGYQTKDTANFLKHWINHKPPLGQEDFPVVYIDPDDAAAYASWKGKRLPSEREWQFAAQGNDLRKYPWGNQPDSTKCNFNLNHPTPVTIFPAGASPFGVEDMIGNVWQMTSDIYDNGAYYFTIIRGGSYFHPTQSILASPKK
ncbi:MAG: SUMF1/EgtB/PvdO family nonheme iron enzyme [Bacteroidota bacterium]